jgi:RNA polymerase sigma-70 factor (ECF subfamily)
VPSRYKTTGSREDSTGPRGEQGEDADETLWIEQAVGGDSEACRLLVEKYQGPIFGLALRMIRDREQALEAAQDAFIKAFRGLHRFEARSRFSTWLYRIAVNVCYDRLARRPGPGVIGIDELIEQGAEPSAGPGWSGDEDVERKESEQAFEEALSALSETYRLPFVLRQIEERPYEEVAEVLSISVANAKVRVHRAREMMVAWLKQRGAL